MTVCVSKCGCLLVEVVQIRNLCDKLKLSLDGSVIR